MALWKLYPKARLHDPHWLDHSYKQPLLVEARSASEARLKAAVWERRGFSEHYGNESPAGRSAFEDEKLYGSVEVQDKENDEGNELLLIS